MILDQILKRKIINHLHHVSLKHFKCVSISCKWHCEDELKVKVNESIVSLFLLIVPFLKL